MLFMQLSQPFFVIADPHLYHKTMERRGWRPEGYTEMIIDNWRNRVNDDDLIFVLGDVCFDIKRCRKVIPELPGHKILIKGNHDHWSKGRIWKLGFELIVDDMIMVRYYLGGGKRFKNVVMSHYYYSKRELGGKLPVRDFILIHGHSHTKRPFVDVSVPAVNVCAEYLEYSPWSIDEILSVVKSRGR